MNIEEVNTLKIADVIYVKSLEAKYLIQKAIFVQDMYDESSHDLGLCIYINDDGSFDKNKRIYFHFSESALNQKNLRKMLLEKCKESLTYYEMMAEKEKQFLMRLNKESS